MNSPVGPDIVTGAASVEVRNWEVCVWGGGGGGGERGGGGGRVIGGRGGGGAELLGWLVKPG